MPNLLSIQRHLIHINVALNIYGFASSLIGVFIPLVIINSGRSLWEIPAYYLFYSTFKLVLNYPVVLLIQRKGAPFGLGASFIGSAVQALFIIAYTASPHFWLLVTSAAALSFTNAFLWNSQHLYISKAMEDDTKSSSLATISIIGQFTGIVAPLLGGFVGAYLGSKYLLFAAVLCYLAALTPLRAMHIFTLESGEFVETKKEKIRYNFHGAPIRDIWANYFVNIETAIGVMVWPIYLALYIKSYKSIGLISSISVIATIVTTWIAGHRGDKGKDRSVLKQGVTVNSLVDIARIFATTTVSVTIVSSAYKASLAYFGNAWVSTYYSHAKQKGLQYIMSMEIACDLAYVTLWSVLLATLLLSDSRTFFVVSFLIAAAAAWGCLLVTKQGELQQG